MKQQRLIAAVVIALCSFSAKADVFNFSYTFGSGDIASGSLSGTQNGLYVENISNVSVFFNGSAFIGNPNLYQPYSFIAGCCFVPGGSVMSFDANLNNFYFADAPPNTLPLANAFYMNGTDIDYWNTGDQSPLRYAVAYGSNYSIRDVSANIPPTYPGGTFNASHWLLAAANPVAAVPEPETYAMLLAGLGLLGVAGRRRKNLAT